MRSREKVLAAGTLIFFSVASKMEMSVDLEWASIFCCIHSPADLTPVHKKQLNQHSTSLSQSDEAKNLEEQDTRRS
jgi:hypothetical protein